MNTQSPNQKKSPGFSPVTFFLTIFIVALVTFFASRLYYTNSTDQFEYSKDRKPIGNLTVQRAVQMVKCYRNYSDAQRIPSPNGRPTIDSTITSIYFDFKSMGAYMLRMAYTEHASGFRIYFAKYDSTEHREYSDASGNYSLNLKGFNTVVFVPTKIINKEIHDIIGENKGPNKAHLFNILEQPELQAQNGGISCPPYPPSVCNGQNLLKYSVNPSDTSFLNLY